MHLLLDANEWYFDIFNIKLGFLLYLINISRKLDKFVCSSRLVFRSGLRGAIASSSRKATFFGQIEFECKIVLKKPINNDHE